MHPAPKFLVDFGILIYLLIKSIICAFIPKKLMFKEVKDEIVLITGGGSGLGQLLAIKFASLGCRVIVWDINEKGGQQTVKLIKEKGGIGHYYFCDVSKRNDIYGTALKVKNEIGQVSILVNNAGVVTGNPFLKCSDESIENTFRVNTLSHFWTCKSFLPDMISNNHGHIVTIASVAGYVPLCGLTDYCSSKGAAVMFHESLYMELKKDNCIGVKTTLICPYHINTNLFKGFALSLLPTMEPEYVADKIIALIRSNTEEAVIPKYIGMSLVLKSMVGISVSTKVIEMLNGFTAMEKVNGQKKNKTR